MPGSEHGRAEPGAAPWAARRALRGAGSLSPGPVPQTGMRRCHPAGKTGAREGKQLGNTWSRPRPWEKRLSRTEPTEGGCGETAALRCERRGKGTSPRNGAVKRRCPPGGAGLRLRKAARKQLSGRLGEDTAANAMRASGQKKHSSGDLKINVKLYNIKSFC